ncbi:MAG: glycoside hydrolase family 13 protein [Oscillospiraceae bacterium]|nr:glycoside hydrolase family 13 protein [Oscillospiraceae bacterium]
MLDLPIFHSRDAGYRRPFGALPRGTAMDITFMPPRIWGALRVMLVAEIEESGEVFEIQLEWQEHKRDRDVYVGSLSTNGILGLVWYHFRIERGINPPLFYGQQAHCKGGEGCLSDLPVGYQLTVYDGKAYMPDWYGKGLTYHIFADRFAQGNVAPAGDFPRTLHTNWNATPTFAPTEEGIVLNNDFFGGNLAGILEKLDYIESLGVKTIFLSPIFEAASNHRYDTGDYLKIDPLLGDEDDFQELCKVCETRGIRVMLDGVFNHAGYDSRYFNGYSNYDEVGAYQSKDSRYFDWFHFDNWPDEYASWWGILILPKLNVNNPDLRKFLLDGKDSVVRKWLNLGASGWRLDVVDEVPDDFVAQLRRSAQTEKKDAVVIGEVWEDASNKIAYSVRRRYFWGDELDGVMNYPLRNALLAYVLGGSAHDFVADMECLRENYPRFAYYNLMNALGTHDTPRILTVLGSDPTAYHATKAERADVKLSPQQRELAIKRLKIATLILYCFPGSPCLYYGDEAGSEGYEDPLNRRTYPWGREDNELIAWHRELGELRNKNAALQEGGIEYHDCTDNVLCFTRMLGSKHVTVRVDNRTYEYSYEHTRL